MRWSFEPGDPAESRVRARPDRALLQEGRVFRWDVAQCGCTELAVVIGPENAECGIAERCRLGEHGVEDRREVAWRGVDHLKHLGRCGLPLQRLAEFCSALLDLPLESGIGLLQVRSHPVEPF